MFMHAYRILYFEYVQFFVSHVATDEIAPLGNGRYLDILAVGQCLCKVILVGDILE